MGEEQNRCLYEKIFYQENKIFRFSALKILLLRLLYGESFAWLNTSLLRCHHPLQITLPPCIEAFIQHKIFPIYNSCSNIMNL